MFMKIIEKIISSNNEDFNYSTEGILNNNVLEFDEYGTNVKIILNKNSKKLANNLHYVFFGIYF